MMADEQAKAWMRQALVMAAEGLASGEVPIGAIVLFRDGRIVGAAHSTMSSPDDVMLHAEMVALQATPAHPFLTNGLTLVSTLEPCSACKDAAIKSGVERIIYGLEMQAPRGPVRVPPATADGTATAPLLEGGVMARHSRELFLAWMAGYQDDPSRASQRAFIEELLHLTEVP